MGASGGGIWGMAPSYLTERFPTAVRGVGPGLSYHVGAALGSLTPFVLGRLQDGGMTTGSAMMVCIAVSGLLVAASSGWGRRPAGVDSRPRRRNHTTKTLPIDQVDCVATTTPIRSRIGSLDLALPRQRIRAGTARVPPLTRTKRRVARTQPWRSPRGAWRHAPCTVQIER